MHLIYLYKIIDDTSRFDIASFIVSKATTQVAIDLVNAAINITGIVPSTIKTDRGTQFKDIFDNYLRSINSTHLKSIPYFPHCNSKVERVFLDVEQNICEDMDMSIEKKELARMVMIETLEHNYVRPHESLGGLTPAEVYLGIGDYIKGKMRSFCDTVKRTCIKCITNNTKKRDIS